MDLFRISCRDTLTFHVTTDDVDSATMACWRSWRSSNLIPRLTRVMAETGSDAEYVFGVGIWKMHILLIRFLDNLKEKLNPKKAQGQ
ncbi:uncharacterized protein LOC143449467 [Clavelina lepadiformis]|uniref:uncharacterized protein LOC143449467 n=1 Tax=Clavelina lepadiformis TaxID=159417 RepID=UPI004042F8FC